VSADFNRCSGGCYGGYVARKQECMVLMAVWCASSREALVKNSEYHHRPLMTSSSANLSIDTADSETESLKASSSCTLYDMVNRWLCLA
jgi:hypothetical protein